jgi:hypothetical protein
MMILEMMELVKELPVVGAEVHRLDVEQEASAAVVVGVHLVQVMMQLLRLLGGERNRAVEGGERATIGERVELRRLAEVWPVRPLR